MVSFSLWVEVRQPHVVSVYLPGNSLNCMLSTSGSSSALERGGWEHCWACRPCSDFQQTAFFDRSKRKNKHCDKRLYKSDTGCRHGWRHSPAERKTDITWIPGRKHFTYINWTTNLITSWWIYCVMDRIHLNKTNTFLLFFKHELECAVTCWTYAAVGTSLVLFVRGNITNFDWPLSRSTEPCYIIKPWYVSSDLVLLEVFCFA